VCTPVQQNLPDLTAGVISPTSVIAGVASTFFATISNANTPTGAGFTDVFQARASGTDNPTDIGTSASAALSAGGTSVASLSYTFSATGTYYMRACADKSSAGDNSGVIAESDETNNCGPWTTVIVSVTPPGITGIYSNTPSCTSTPFIALAWDWNTRDQNGDMKYHIYRGSSPSTLVQIVLQTSDGYSELHHLPLNYIDSTVTAGSVYYYKVIAFNGDVSGIIGPITAPSPCPLYSCTTAPTNATLCSGDDTGLTANTTSTVVNSCSTPTGSVPKCEYTCSSGYVNNGGACTSALPDLTAGVISPVSATLATASTFFATISNANASTSAGFTTLFQKSMDGNANAIDIGTSASAALSAGGTSVASLSYTFSNTGTYYMRACADKSSAVDAGVIAESDENNNCGPWTAITVSSSAGGCTNDGTLPTSGVYECAGTNKSPAVSTPWTTAGAGPGSCTSLTPAQNVCKYYTVAPTPIDGCLPSDPNCLNGSCISPYALASTGWCVCPATGCSISEVSCFPTVKDSDPTSPTFSYPTRATFANVGQLVTWQSQLAGTMTGTWSGDGVVGSPTGSVYSITYSTIGNKNVYLTLSSDPTHPVQCSADITGGTIKPLLIINNPGYHEF
jgi:hypothetical protein